MDYSKLSNKELAELRKQVEAGVSRLNNYQMALKIALNSAYGALG